MENLEGEKDSSKTKKRLERKRTMGVLEFVENYQFPPLEALLFAESTWNVQVTLLVVQAIFWKLAIPTFSDWVVRPYASNKPWKDQWLRLNAQSMGNMGITPPKDEEALFTFSCNMIGVLLQHGIGGGLCALSLTGLFSPNVSNALACHGALCEAGWEFQDALTRFGQIVFGGKKGRELNPPALVIFLTLHHAMGLLLVLPMNMYFRESWAYHEGAMLLEGAAFVAMMLQNYGFTINIKEGNGLAKMKASVLITFCIMLYSRGFRYVYVVYHVCLTLYEAQAFKMFYGAIMVATFMSLLNVAMITDASAKLKKFWLAAGQKKKDHQMIRQASSAFSASGAGLNGIPLPPVLTSSQKNWAKLRGAVLFGGVGRDAPKDKDKDQ